MSSELAALSPWRLGFGEECTTSAGPPGVEGCPFTLGVKINYSHMQTEPCPERGDRALSFILRLWPWG